MNSPSRFPAKKALLFGGAFLILGALFYFFGLRPNDFTANIFAPVLEEAVVPAMCTDGNLVGQDSETVVLKPKNADVEVRKSVPENQKNVKIDDSINYTVFYRNLGPETANQVRIIDDYDETRITVQSATISPAGICVDDGSKITCTFQPPLTKDAAGNLTYTAKAKAIGTALNTAVISTSTPETNLANNTSTATVNISSGGGNAPTCTLTASPAQIASGGTSVLNWTINGGVNSASIDQGIGAVAIPVGAQTVTPTATTVYTLTAVGPGGTATCSATVTLSTPQTPAFTFQKQANPTVARVEDTITYTLNYANTGSMNAASVIIRDDYDETRLTNITVPSTCIVGGGEIVCNVGALAAGSSGQLTYTGVIANTVKSGETVRNVATFTADQHPPLTSEAIVTVRGLIITKDVTPASVVSGQEVTYTVTVENTLPTPQTFTIQDVQAPGDNGGRLDFTREVTATFIPQSSGTFTGNDPIAFHVTNLAGGAKIQIAYKYKASDEQINFNEQSLFKNVATIVETGDKDDAEVIVRGPTSGGGCQTNCGGGGGGGGSRIIYGDVDVNIEKEVKDKDGKWQDADTFDVAAMIPYKKEQPVSYRLRLTNSGKFAGTNLKVSDVFESADLEKLEMKNIRGAEFDAEKGEFAIEEIGSKKTITISYDLVLKRREVSLKALEGENTATITEVEPPDNLSSRYRLRETRGVGEEDSAFIVTAKGKGKVILVKRVDKNIVKPGEEVNYILTLRNIAGQDLEGLVLTDLFPFEHLEFISSNFRAIQKDGKTEYRNNFLAEKKAWVIWVKARVKASVPGGTVIRNFAAVSAENEDLSKLHAETQITVETRPMPVRLISTGPEAALALLALGTVCFFVGMRKRREA